MLTQEMVIEFLGWCSVINILLLMITTLGIVFFHNSIVQIHGKLFNLNKEDLGRTYFGYMALYKVLIIVFNIVPYIALKLI